MVDKEIFKDYTVQDLFEQIVNNSRETRMALKDIIKDISERVKDTVDLQILSPEISDYMNTLVKNDEILLKLANIVVKAETSKLSQQGGQLILTPQEKQQLIKSVRQDMEPYILKNENKIAKTN